MNTPVFEPREAGGRDAGVLERLQRELEEQALLRVHRAASRGEIPKNGGRIVDASRNPPQRVTI